MATTNDYSDEDLANLTEEEREAFLAEDDSEEEADDANDDGAADDQSGGDGDDGDAGDDDGDGDGAGTEDEGAEADEAAGKGAAGQEGGGEEGDARSERWQAPLLSPDLPDDIEEQMAAIKQERAELRRKYDDGELTLDEYEEQKDALDDRRLDLREQMSRAKIAQEMQERQAQQAWLDTVNDFLDANPEYRENELRYNALDAAVKKVAAEDQSLSGREIMARAHQMVLDAFGLTKSDEGKAEQQPRRQKRKVDVPPTLGKVPAAEGTEVQDGKWSRLDRLMETDPERYESEMAKMSDADREAYLAAR